MPCIHTTTSCSIKAFQTSKQLIVHLKNFHAYKIVHVTSYISSIPPDQQDTSLVSQQLLEATPTLHELNRYITDMAPSYYNIGIQLGIDNRELKLIKNDHISFSGFEQKCHRMLEIWLDKNSTSVTWKKLCDTLERLELNFLAGKMKDAIVDDKLQP